MGNEMNSVTLWVFIVVFLFFLAGGMPGRSVRRH